MGGGGDSPDSHILSGTPVTTSDLLGLRMLLVCGGRLSEMCEGWITDLGTNQGCIQTITLTPGAQAVCAGKAPNPGRGAWRESH